jgi:flagellar hook protein FlgE
MLRSMFTAVTGLRSHQVMMDVTGNNMANVNTVGFKSSSTVFQDLLSQMIAGASALNPNEGGINPAMVGLGVRVAGTALNMSQGATQMTNKNTDLSLQGDGFFILRQNGQQLYTRAGAFNFDALGRLVSPDGGILQGWTADPDGNISMNVNPTDLRMPLGQSIPPLATTAIKLQGNLDASSAIGNEVTSSVTIHDQQGTVFQVQVKYTKAAANSWNVTATTNVAGVPTNVPITGGPLTFSPTTGAVTSGALTAAMPAGQFAGPVTLDTGTVGAPDAVTGFAGTSTLIAARQNGYGMGILQSFTVGGDGTMMGVFSNGRNRAVGRVALASFTNPTGLEVTGGSMYRETANSGVAQVGPSNSGGRGLIAAGTLEMSNADLAREFTNLILAQRGFQANSRMIAASDEVLQDLVNLKR